MTWPWSLDTQPLIAGTDLIRLNTAPGHGFIRRSGVRARYLFSHLSPCTGQWKSRVQGQHRVLVAPNEHGGRQQGGAAEQVQPGHVERGADHGAALRPLGQRQRDHHQLRAGGVVTHHLRQAEKTEMSAINTSFRCGSREGGVSRNINCVSVEQRDCNSKSSCQHLNFACFPVQA